jgi:hypothetical protein
MRYLNGEGVERDHHRFGSIIAGALDQNFVRPYIRLASPTLQQSKRTVRRSKPNAAFLVTGALI